MSIVLIIICVVVLVYSFNYRSKIDQEEKVALKTPGTADRLRSNFPGLISMLLSNPSHTILMERKYDESIRIGNDDRQELFLSFSALGGPQIHVACIDHSQVLKEWKFERELSDSQIFNEINYYFK